MLNHFIDMVDINRKTYETCSAEMIVNNDWIMWLKEKDILKGLDQKKASRNYSKISFR